jgi:hypothetical protein
MNPALFDELERTLSAEGAEPAIDRLCSRLREGKDYTNLFYALLLKERHALGVSPVPTGPSSELPEAVHGRYEDAIRAAARLVGGLHLDSGELPQAWAYFRMIGEPDKVRTALEGYQPAEDEDLQPLVNIAFYEGVHPTRGFGWVLTRYGLCNAITTLSSQELPHTPEAKQECVRMLVRALYAELRERLAAEITRHDGNPPPEAAAPEGQGGVVRKLMEGRDWLFADEFYHIDVSHLSSVVQLAERLTICPELELVRELCEYGRHLSGRFVNRGDPPFENLYEGYGHYYALLAGADVEKNLAYFRTKAAEADPETVGTYPAEVLVNLLLRLERPAEALAVARQYLAKVDNRRLTCPGIADLCREVKDYRTLAEVAREQGDAVHFMAGLLAARGG